MMIGKVTVSVLYYGVSTKLFLYWHEEVRGGRIWRHLSMKISIPIGSDALNVSKLLRKELRPSIWTSTVKSYFWTLFLRYLLWWLQTVLVGSLLKRAIIGEPSSDCYTAVVKGDIYNPGYEGGAFYWRSGFLRNCFNKHDERDCCPEESYARRNMK